MRYRFVWDEQIVDHNANERHNMSKFPKETEIKYVLKGYYNEEIKGYRGGYRGVRILGVVYLIDAEWRWSTILEGAYNKKGESEKDVSGIADSEEEGKILVEEALVRKGIKNIEGKE